MNDINSTIWVEMGQFSGEGTIHSDIKKLKVGDKVNILLVSDQLEECVIIKDEHSEGFYAMPISDWWVG